MTPTVSVIIPTYNRADMLRNALKSVIEQEYRDLDVIVVDDASTDDTRKVVASIDDPRVRLVRHEDRRGGSAARNTGIRLARGEIVAFLDSDDEWLPAKIREQVRVFADDPSCGVVYTGFVDIDDRGRATYRRRVLPEGWLVRELFTGNVVGTASTVAVRRQCFEEVGLFDETLPSCQDWDMWIRLAKRCRFRAIPRPLVRYYRHGGPQISKARAAVREGHERVFEKHIEAARALGPEVEAAFRFHIGRVLCGIGELQEGRGYLASALVVNPRFIRPAFYLMATFLGDAGYGALRGLKAGVTKLLRRSREGDGVV